MTMSSPPGRRRVPTTGKRVGYVIAAAFNALFLWIAHQLLDWQWPRFLTDEFADVLPLITVSFVAGIVVNLAYVWYDDPWFKSVGEIVNGAISLAVAIDMYAVFPFDFSSYATDWSWLARLVLIVAIVGTSIGVVVEVVRVITSLAAGSDSSCVESPLAESRDERTPV